MPSPSIVTCPACKYEHGRVHSIEIYAANPIQTFSDGDVMLFVGLCPHVGDFIARTTGGWMRLTGIITGSRQLEVLGDELDDLEGDENETEDLE